MVSTQYLKHSKTRTCLPKKGRPTRKILRSPRSPENSPKKLCLWVHRFACRLPHQPPLLEPWANSSPGSPCYAPLWTSAELCHYIHYDARAKVIPSGSKMKISYRKGQDIYATSCPPKIFKGSLVPRGRSLLRHHSALIRLQHGVSCDMTAARRSHTVDVLAKMRYTTIHCSMENKSSSAYVTFERYIANISYDLISKKQGKHKLIRKLQNQTACGKRQKKTDSCQVAPRPCPVSYHQGLSSASGHGSISSDW